MNNISDQKIRKKFFWIVLAIAVGIIASGFIIEKSINYNLLRKQWIKFGYTGFQLAKIPSQEEVGHKKRIAMIGNSVYQYIHIPEQIQQIADKEQRPYVFMNMAQVSSTIYDYLAQTAKVVGSHPDLVVFCMNEGTFSLEPKFKTDSDQFVFDRDVLKVMPASFYYRYFDYKTGTDSALSTLIPLKRIDPILRWEFKLRSWFPEWFFKWVSYPSLSIALGGNVKTVQMTQYKKSAGDEKFIVLNEILDLLQKNKIPALFIWQEVQNPQSTPTSERIRRDIESRDNTVFADLSSFWDPNVFSDSIHPKQAYADQYAKRHYDAVVKAMAFFENKEKRKQKQ